MSHTTHSARIVGPVRYTTSDGRQLRLPLGPCLIEQFGKRPVDIVWGVRGQNSARLPFSELEAAEERGSLVVLG